MWLEWHQFMDRLCIDLVRTEALFSTDTTWDAITAIWDKVNRTYPAGTTIGRALGQTGDLWCLGPLIILVQCGVHSAMPLHFSLAR